MNTSRRPLDEYAKEIASKFEQYMNSDNARHTLAALDEGESITIENTEVILKVEKKDGRAVVDFVRYVHDKDKI